jgi:protein-S-isoprenylcysteine O-methyltransferase Ste14
VEDDHQLITSGIYKYIRHQIYLGSIILFASIGIAIGSLVVTLIIFLLWSILMWDRINLEEKLLTEKFGDEYIKYKNGTKKLIPYLY